MKAIGLIGLGYWGKNILRNLVELDLLHTACDTSAQIIENHKKNYPNINYSSEINHVINNPEITGIMIATPAATHYDIAKQALNAGKDVFIEKPLALKVFQGEELVNLAKEKNRILMVGHILQYHPAMIKLKMMIKNGELGKVQYIYSNRLNLGKLRTEENILWSFAPHDISVILMLIDEEPIEITGMGESYLNEDIYDVTLTNLKFKNKVHAHIFVSWLHPFKEQKLVVVGSKAMAVFDDMTQEKLFLYPHEITWKDGRIPEAHKAERIAVPIENKEPLKEEILHFFNCLHTRSTPKTDGHEGLRVLKVLEQAEENYLAR